MHQKRSKVPNSWPISRKGSTYVVLPKYNVDKGLPVLVIIRDVLKIAKNRKEVKKALNAGNILVNNKKVYDDRNTVSLFDSISIVPSKKHYRISISEKGKFKLEEIKKSEVGKKIGKITNKTKLKGNKIQLNFLDGRNIISDKKEKVDTHSSALIDLKENKIEKILPLKEKANVMVIKGKHAGKTGKVEKINQEHNRVEITNKKEKIETKDKYIVVIE